MRIGKHVCPDAMPNATGSFAIFIDRRLGGVLLLGVISGFLWTLIRTCLSLWLAEAGVSRTAIGWVGLIFAVLRRQFSLGSGDRPVSSAVACGPGRPAPRLDLRDASRNLGLSGRMEPPRLGGRLGRRGPRHRHRVGNART